MKLLLISLLLSVLIFSSLGTTGGSSHAGKPTSITWHTQSSVVYLGEKIKVTGKLVDANTGEGVVDVVVKILDSNAVGPRILDTAITRNNGVFAARFDASLADPTKQGTLYLVAKFDGSEKYKSSISREQPVRVKLLPLDIKFDLLKTRLKDGESAEIIFIVTSRRQPVEPDAMWIVFDGKTVSATNYGTGNYVYETPQLSKGKHAFFVSASKTGHNAATQMVTLYVN